MKIVSKNPFEDFYDGRVFDERKALEYLWLCPDFRINATAKLFKWSTTKLYSFLEKVDIKCKKNTPKNTAKKTPPKVVTITKTNTSLEVTENKKTPKKTGKKTLEERKLAFGNKLVPYMDKYGREMIREFFDYWTEINDGGKLMAFEKTKKKTFNISYRLSTWNKKEYGNTKTRDAKYGNQNKVKADEWTNEDTESLALLSRSIKIGK